MIYTFDTEFLDAPAYGKPGIDLISIGVVCEDGREFYAETPRPDMWWSLDGSLAWLRENVRPHLTGAEAQLPHDEIARQLQLFVADGGGKPKFFAYVGAYDWVAMMSLFGPLIEKPAGWPMTYLEMKPAILGWKDVHDGLDPRVFIDDYGPKGPDHHALADARQNMFLMRVMGFVK